MCLLSVCDLEVTAIKIIIMFRLRIDERIKSPVYLYISGRVIVLLVYICRDLPELAKHFVMRLLFVEQPVSQAVIGLWVSNRHTK